MRPWELGSTVGGGDVREDRGGGPVAGLGLDRKVVKETYESGEEGENRRTRRKGRVRTVVGHQGSE